MSKGDIVSAESTLAFWGIKFELSASDIEPCETRSDPRQRKARAANLDQYFGNFGGDPEVYLLFIGKRLAVIGAESSSDLILSKAHLLKIVEETNAKLSELGFLDEAALHVVWQPDA